MLHCRIGGGRSRGFMLYAFHELAYHSATPFRIGAQMARQFWTSPFNPASDTAIGRTAYASAEVFESLTRRYGKPDWGLETLGIDGKPVRTTIHPFSKPKDRATAKVKRADSHSGQPQ